MANRTRRYLLYRHFRQNLEARGLSITDSGALLLVDRDHSWRTAELRPAYPVLEMGGRFFHVTG